MSVLIYTDTSSYELLRRDLDTIAAKAQQIVDLYNIMELEPLVTADLPLLVTNPAQIVFNKVTGGAPVTIGGLIIDPVKAMEILQKPVGYTDFIAAAQGLPTWFKEAVFASGASYHVNQFFKSCEIDESGNVQVTAAADAKLVEQSKKYATSDRAVKSVALGNAVLAALEAQGLLETLKNNPNGIAGFFDEILEISRPGRNVQLNVKGILRLN